MSVPPPPGTVYFVCATERSGSTLLCESLKRTGVAGCPQEYFEALIGTGMPRRPSEYFPDALAGELAPLLPDVPVARAPELADFGAYLRDAIERGTTPNGVFGAKLMWGYLRDFETRLGASVFDAFPRARFVRVTRKSKVAQAVSLWKAIQTQAWRAEDPADPHQPVYHADAIGSLVAYLEEGERRWAELLPDALCLSYERVVRDLDGSVRAVLEHLGVDAPRDLAIEPPLERQADERSQRWVARYEREAAQRKPMLPVDVSGELPVRAATR